MNARYACTDMALGLHESLSGLVDWAERHRTDTGRAHAACDAPHSGDRETGGSPAPAGLS